MRWKRLVIALPLAIAAVAVGKFQYRHVFVGNRNKSTALFSEL
jgi:hypothetical protein